MRKFILRWLFGCDVRIWEEIFTIANDYWFEKYESICKKYIAVLEAVKNSSDLHLKDNVVEILNSGAKMNGGDTDE